MYKNFSKFLQIKFIIRAFKDDHRILQKNWSAFSQVYSQTENFISCYFYLDLHFILSKGKK